jgi:transposase
MKPRKEYPSDVTDVEWAFVAPYLTLMVPTAPQRRYALRDLFDAARWLAHTGAPWRYLPGDFPPWEACYQQTQRWMRAKVFEDIVHDLREMLRVAQGRPEKPRAAILDARTLQSSPESGARAGYDGHKKKRGSKVHLACDTLGELLALVITPANEQERSQVSELAHAVQEATGESVEVAYVDQGYTGEAAAQAAREAGIALQVVQLPQAKRGFVLLPRRWVIERSFAWAARFRRLSRDYERLATTLAGMHYLVFACLMLVRAWKLCWSA